MEISDPSDGDIRIPESTVVLGRDSGLDEVSSIIDIRGTSDTEVDDSSSFDVEDDDVFD